MNLARILLLLGALVFIFIGVVFLAAPVEWGRVVQIELPTPMARTDLRATYGGFDLGFGIFLGLCAFRREWHRPGLAAAAIALAGFGLARSFGMLMEGTASPLMMSLAVAELSGSGAAFLSYRRLGRDVSR